MIAVSHHQNAQEAIINILADNLRQHKNQPGFFVQLRVADDLADDELASSFEGDKDH